LIAEEHKVFFSFLSFQEHLQRTVQLQHLPSYLHYPSNTGAYGNLPHYLHYPNATGAYVNLLRYLHCPNATGAYGKMQID